jgi:hypothetical protein
MRNETRKGAARGILAAAAMSALVGATCARGDFIVQMTKTTVGGDDVYVLAAQNDGTLNSGTTLAGTDTTISAANPMVIDLADDVNGDGFADANVGGAPDENPYSYSEQPTPAFGGILGTFVGIANSPTGRNAKTTVNSVFINGNVDIIGGTQAVYETTAADDVQTGFIDPNFTNGTVTALEVVSSGITGGTLDTTGFVPFANIVVPTGTPVNFHGLLGGNTGNGFAFVGTSANGFLPAIGPIGIVGQNAGSATISTGQNGLVPTTINIASQSQTSGFVTIKGFTSGENQIYGLTITGENSLSQLISDINTAVGIEDPGAVAIDPTTATGGDYILGLPGFASTDVEVIIPSPAGLTVNQTSDFSFDFDSYTSNEDGPPILTSIHVIPEPTSLTLLGLGGATLLARRRRARA